MKRGDKTKEQLLIDLDAASQLLNEAKAIKKRLKEAQALDATRITLLEFASSHTLEELLKKTLDEVGKFTDSSIGFCHFVESDQKTISLQAWSTRTSKEFCQTKGKGLHYSIDQAGVWVDCVRTKQPVIHNDYVSLPHRKGLPVGHTPVIREMVVPIIKNNRIVAILGVGNKPTNYTERDIELTAYLANIAWDITERKRTEEALIASENRYRRLFETAKDGIIIIDVETGLIIDVNHFLIDLLGFPKTDIIGKELWEIGFLKDIVANKDKFDELCHKGYVRYEDLPLRKIGGQQAHVEFISNVYNVNRQKIIQCNIRDITERKRAEVEKHQLQQKAEISSRLASVGEMTAGIAHEINNPLTGVLGFSELLLQEDLPFETMEHVKYIVDGSKRVRDVVKRLLTFARQTIPQKTNLNIHELIDNTLALRNYVHETASIEVAKDYDASLPWLTIDPGQIQQVFMNLIINAEYSMKKAHNGGKLIVTTKADNSHACISFKDNGEGIPEKTISKLFSPFYTTKDLGEGTGLGLSISRSIILEHGGTLEVESKPGKGAIFTIKLPITPQIEQQLPKVKDVAFVNTKTAVKTASILVIDDEPSIRALIEHVLKSNGWVVEVVTSSTDALLKFEKTIYDVVLMDIRMPGMSGTDLYAEIKIKWPEMARRTIFITGDTSDANTREFLRKHKLPYLAKPFGNNALIEKVNELLEKRQ